MPGCFRRTYHYCSVSCCTVHAWRSRLPSSTSLTTNTSSLTQRMPPVTLSMHNNSTTVANGSHRTGETTYTCVMLCHLLFCSLVYFVSHFGVQFPCYVFLSHAICHYCHVTPICVCRPKENGLESHGEPMHPAKRAHTLSPISASHISPTNPAFNFHLGGPLRLEDISLSRELRERERLERERLERERMETERHYNNYSEFIDVALIYSLSTEQLPL